MGILLVFCLIFTFAANGRSDVASIISPDLVRKNPGENCKLQWKVSGSFLNYTILSLTTGSPKSLGLNTDTGYDSINGIVTLYIWNVQTQNAGFYVLTLNSGSQSIQSSNAILFVYGTVSSSVTNPSLKTDFTEGDVIELNCSVTSYSVPQAFKPNTYYFWQIGNYGNLQNASSGPATSTNGDIATGYSLKSGGQILAISTSQIIYFGSYFYCQAQEEGSYYRSSSNAFQGGLRLQRRPFIYSIYPPSKKWNWSPSIYGSYSFQFYFSSTPALSSYSNWSFVDSLGNEQDIPPSTNLTASSYTSLNVPLSGGNVGNYSITLANKFGSADITFQLLPAGIPDSPSDFKVQYVTHSLVSLQWRCGWNNGDPQIVTIRLEKSADNTVVETLKTSLFSNTQCYNLLFSSTFRSIVVPDTDYKASIWASNGYGRSSVATLTVRTPARPAFSVSCEGISLGDSTAIVNVTTPVVGVWLNVSCCVEATAQCVLQAMTLLSPSNQIVLDPIPAGDAYVFDFVLFNGSFNYVYNLALMKGVKKSRSSGCNVPGGAENNGSLLIAVIVLASLLGVAVLFIVCLACILLRRGLKRNTQSEPKQVATSFPPTSRRKTERDSEINPYANYEGIIKDDEGDDFYTTLEDNPPAKPPQIPMQRF